MPSNLRSNSQSPPVPKRSWVSVAAIGSSHSGMSSAFDTASDRSPARAGFTSRWCIRAVSCAAAPPSVVPAPMAVRKAIGAQRTEILSLSFEKVVRAACGSCRRVGPPRTTLWRFTSAAGGARASDPEDVVDEILSARQWRAARRRRAGAHAPAVGAPGRHGPEGHQIRVRRGPVRRLHGAARRSAHALVRNADRLDRHGRGHHHRDLDRQHRAWYTPLRVRVGPRGRSVPRLRVSAVSCRARRRRHGRPVPGARLAPCPGNAGSTPQAACRSCGGEWPPRRPRCCEAP